MTLLRAAGFDARRVPLSGAQEGYPGDVVAAGMVWQVKRRARGLKSLYAWLDGHDVLAVRADHKPWLVVMPLKTWLEREVLRQESSGDTQGASAQEEGEAS